MSCANVLDHATSEIAIGSKLGINATKSCSGVTAMRASKSKLLATGVCLPVLKVCAWAALLTIHAAAQEISWSIPADGGTPRDTNRIQRIGPREFRVRASFEEGGQSVLRHAVSRVDLLCRNSASQPADVILHLDLSGDGQRTDYDNKPELLRAWDERPGENH